MTSVRGINYICFCVIILLNLNEWKFKTQQAVYVYCNAETCSCNHCCSGKAISIICNEHVFVALVIQYAMCMHHIVICGLPRSTSFFTQLISWIFWGGVILNIKYVFRFCLQLLCETLFIQRRIEREMIKKYVLHVKYLLFWYFN